eukprot:TRINITY_DN6713_c2_g1_i1.p1 TRINITY_DN6713_c2_g1~~TRINITY_DN6713_c2_g1_i1.p1  ORF type:complete len:631 (+),score=174.92 TRINITY_DN6713_c2_g1_i1:50-1894(+)
MFAAPPPPFPPPPPAVPPPPPPEEQPPPPPPDDWDAVLVLETHCSASQWLPATVVGTRAGWAKFKAAHGPVGKFLRLKTEAFQTKVVPDSATGRPQLVVRCKPKPAAPVQPAVAADQPRRPAAPPPPGLAGNAASDVLTQCNAVEWTPVGVVSQRVGWKAKYKGHLGPIGEFLRQRPAVFETKMHQDDEGGRAQLAVRRAPEDPRMEYGRKVQQAVRRILDENAAEEETFEWQAKYREIVRGWWVNEVSSDRVPLEDVGALSQQERMWIQAWAAREGIAISAADGAVCAVRQGTTSDPGAWKDLGPCGRFARFGSRVVSLSKGDPPEGVLVFSEALSTKQISSLKELTSVGIYVHARPGWTVVAATHPLTDTEVALSTEVPAEDLASLGGVCRDVNESRRNNEEIFAARSAGHLEDLIDGWCKCSKGLSFVNVANALHRVSEPFSEASLRYLARQISDMPAKVGTQECANLLQGLQRMGSSPGALALYAAVASKVNTAAETYTGRIGADFVAHCLAAVTAPHVRPHAANPAVGVFFDAVAGRVRKCDDAIRDEHVGSTLRMIQSGELAMTESTKAFVDAVLEKAPELRAIFASGIPPVASPPRKRARVSTPPFE